MSRNVWTKARIAMLATICLFGASSAAFAADQYINFQLVTTNGNNTQFTGSLLFPPAEPSPPSASGTFSGNWLQASLLQGYLPAGTPNNPISVQGNTPTALSTTVTIAAASISNQANSATWNSQAGGYFINSMLFGFTDATGSYIIYEPNSGGAPSVGVEIWTASVNQLTGEYTAVTQLFGSNNDKNKVFCLGNTNFGGRNDLCVVTNEPVPEIDSATLPKALLLVASLFLFKWSRKRAA